MLAKLRVRRSNGGRPLACPDTLTGDKGYSTREIRLDLRRRGIKAVLPERHDRIANASVRAAAQAVRTP
ncbi:hypothetical protein [Nonomuraea sp. B1E8]|uniref:hypothetical protein n=1 Tax=unclassified Nonomuraea TaxID=2593643 RepID=UPI00325D7E13